MDVEQALPTFVAESRELLQEMEAALLACERGGAGPEQVNAVFRAAHTLKGAAGLFGLEDIVTFTHFLETALDRLRSGQLVVSAALTTLLLECADELEGLLSSVASGRCEGRALPAPALRLLERLQNAIGAPSGAAAAGAAAESASGEVPATAAAAARSACAPTADWHLSLRFERDVLRNGMDPLSFLRYLTTFGEIVGIHVVTEALPPPEVMDPECCYLGYELSFRTTAELARIESAFEFVREDCRLEILPPRSPLADYARLIRALREGEGALGAALVRCGTLSAAELEEALAHEARRTDGEEAAGAQTVEERAGSGDARAADRRSIRVDADKLDRLIDLIGELIVAGANTNLIASGAGLRELSESASRLLRLVEEVRDSALTLRTVQIGATFARFHRVVRDVGRQLGKEIELRISGAETELDKTVVERIVDPLTHLVRNAIDHGIEPAELRVPRGKPARGTVHLHAYHDSGTVGIEVSDDGGGIDREKVRAKAIERGLIASDAVLADRELLALVMEPGFSTVSAVTDLSGRGVGMDVVKRNIEALRGSIEIDSREGAGTTVRVRLPLTLAIIEGFLMQVDSACYVVPLELVEECVELPESHAASDNYLDLRGQVLPFLRLRELFELETRRPRRESVVVVRWGGERMGLVVDALLGELQTVIKPLGHMFKRLQGVAGSTILGSGSVALILDVPALAHMATDCRALRAPSAWADRPLA